MMAMTRLFYRAAYGPRMLLLGLTALLLLPVLGTVFAGAGHTAVFSAAFAMVIFGPILALGAAVLAGHWPALLPAERGRVFDAMCLGTFGALLPVAIIVALGMAMAAGDQGARAGVLLVSDIGLIAMVLLALLPGLWIWSPVKRIAALAGLWVGATLLMATWQITAAWALRDVVVVQVLISLVVYWGGKRWFMRFELGERSSAPDEVEEDDEAQRCQVVVPDVAVTKRGWLSPNVQLFMKACWLRWMFAVAIAYAICLGVPVAGNSSPHLQGFWLIFAGLMAPQTMRWLRSQLDVLWPLSRGMVFEGFVVPVQVLYFATILTVEMLQGPGHYYGSEVWVAQAVDRWWWGAWMWALVALALLQLGIAAGLMGVWVETRRRTAKVLQVLGSLIVGVWILWIWFGDQLSQEATIEGIPIDLAAFGTASAHWAYTHRYVVTAALTLFVLAMHWHNHRAFCQADWTTYRPRRWFANDQPRGRHG